MHKNKILIITSSYDKTVDYMVAKFGFDKFYRLNIDNFSQYKISYDKSGFTIFDSIAPPLKEKFCKSIYYRKPTPEDLNNIIDKKYHHHCAREIFSLIDGIVESFNGRCLSKPSIMRLCDNKVFQAKLALSIGLNIPDFILTNDYIECQKITIDKTIIKPLSSGYIIDNNEKEYVQSNLFDNNKDLFYLKFSPCYFQKYCPKDYEVRVTFVKNKCFPIKIASENKVDWRKNGNKIKYSIIDIPNNIYEKCRIFMNEVNIDFGCFDFIVHESQWHFLEINANGQWAWLELELNLDVSVEIMRYLSDE